MKQYSRYYDWTDDFIALTEEEQVIKINAIFDAVRDLRKAVNDKITAYAQAVAASGLGWTDPTLAALETELLTPVEAAADAFTTEATT